jgi:putative transcriptional regulator
MVALSNTLKVHRAMHDMTQGDLADKAGVTRKTINTVENGKFVPSTMLALTLAKVFNVPVEALFSLQD